MLKILVSNSLAVNFYLKHTLLYKSANYCMSDIQCSFSSRGSRLTDMNGIAGVSRRSGFSKVCTYIIKKICLKSLPYH